MSAQIKLITRRPSFKSAYYRVRRELKAYGCWTEQVSNLPIYQIPFSLCYGYQRYKISGAIVIPKVSLSRMWDNFSGEKYVSIRDIIRHEYAHGIAHCHPTLIKSATFKKAFRGCHETGNSIPYDPGVHVSSYAATNPCEDFAEVFMYFLKHNGKIPKAFSGLPAIERKWNFVRSMCRKLKFSTQRA